MFIGVINGLCFMHYLFIIFTCCLCQCVDDCVVIEANRAHYISDAHLNLWNITYLIMS